MSKNLIYQCWEGTPRPSAHYGSDVMKSYAKRIGADYEFDINSGFNQRFRGLGPEKRYYGTLKPIYEDRFLEYDKVMYVDTDIFPVEGLKENIFDTFNQDIGMCTEPTMPDRRAKRADEMLWHRMLKNKYDTECTKREDGKYLVYNAGLVMWSNQGLKHCRSKWSSVSNYVLNVKNAGITKEIYRTDQNYIHAMVFVSNMSLQSLDNEWNRYITWDNWKLSNRKVIDPRTPNTKFVHVQMRGAEDLDNDTHWKVVNRPVSEWGIDKWGKPFEC
jgi:hypothetical protein